MSKQEDIVESILKDLPVDVAVEVELPSENKPYKLEEGTTILLRPMTFDDEKALVSANKQGNPVNLLLERCVENIKVADLIAMDKLYLILKLREISYGDDYDVMLICPKCEAENPITVRLSELPVNPVPDDFTDPITIELPVLKKQVKVRLPRVRDEKVLSDPKNSSDQLWRFVTEIDGHTEKSVIAAVVKKLPLKDIKTIIRTMKTDFGVETQVNLKCTSCGGGSVVDLPISANFFGVN
jgi:hypothetical protein